MTELKDVLQRPKFAKKIESVSGFQFLKLLQQSVKFYSVKKVVSVGPDSEDYFLFSLTNTAKADYLITGDKELLALKNTDRL